MKSRKAIPNTVDFRGLFDTLADPIAVCDEEGNVLAANRQARAYLVVEEGTPLKIDLRARETVRQIRLTNVATAEFFLADVAVDGAGRKRVSASFHPLGDGGGYRVLFAVGPDGRPVSVNIRMLESLINVGRHLDLFKSPDKMTALFAASFVDIFPVYSFRIDLSAAALVHDQQGWEDAHYAGEAESSVFVGTKRSWNGRIGELGELIVERREEAKFAVSERQAFETFAQQLGLALSRVLIDPQNSDAVGVGSIIDHLDAIVVVCDARRCVLVSNNTFESIVGSRDLSGRDVLEFFEDADQAALRLAAATVMATGEVQTLESRLRSTTEAGVHLKVQVAPARGRDAENTAGFVITGQHGELSLVELDERMTRAAQLMNLGELATGVAHELKNPLTSILNYAEYLLAKYQPDAPVETEAPGVFDERDAQRLQRIIAGVAQIDEFVQDLVTLARPGAAQLAPVNVHSTIHESVMMCEVALAQAQTRVELDLDLAHVPNVMGVRNQLKQVFVNLIANAGKSMPSTGGTIVLRTRVEGTNVVCQITDDGEGMSETTQERIFEPFFTTRRTRGGSGLGLALVRTIVERHSGTVAVESTPGKGTTFAVTLPIAHEVP
jgi:signal transduction histidine kinase